MEFTVKVFDGEVYINGEFVDQLCWDGDAIGSAIAGWLNGDYDVVEDEEE